MSLFEEPIFVFVNLFLTLLLPVIVYFCIVILYKVSFVNPVFVIFLFFLPVYLAKELLGPLFLFENGVFDRWYSYSLFIVNFERLIFSLYFLFFSYLFVRFRFSTPLSVVAISKKQFKGLSFIFLSFSLFLMIVLMLKTIGIKEWVMNPRIGYQFHRAGNGHLFAGSIYFLMMSYVCWFFSARRYWVFFSGALVYVLLSYFYGTKMIILSFMASLLVMLWFYKIRFYTVYILFGGVLAFLLMLMNFGAEDILSVLGYFDYHVNSAMFYKYQNDNGLYFDGEIYISGFWQYVPRGLYPDKPYAYGDIIIRELFWPGAAEATHTPGMAGPVGVHGDFGFDGVVLNAFNPLSAFVIAYGFYMVVRGFNQRSVSQYGFFYVIAFCYLLIPSYFIYIPFMMQVLILLALLLFNVVVKRLVYGVGAIRHV